MEKDIEKGLGHMFIRQSTVMLFSLIKFQHTKMFDYYFSIIFTLFFIYSNLPIFLFFWPPATRFGFRAGFTLGLITGSSGNKFVCKLPIV